MRRSEDTIEAVVARLEKTIRQRVPKDDSNVVIFCSKDVRLLLLRILREDSISSVTVTQEKR